MKVEAYNSLDVVNRTAAAEVEVDQLERLHDPDTFSQRFISASFDMKLVEAAYIAGRWGKDPVIASQLDELGATTTDLPAAPAVDSHDREPSASGFPIRLFVAESRACRGCLERRTNAPWALP